jgi:two-component system OmpR family sensor kinase
VSRRGDAPPTTQATSPQGALRESVLERLLAIPATELREALDAAARLIAEALGAEKVDAWFKEPDAEALTAVGVSDTPMGREQRRLGLDRVSLANREPIAGTYCTGVPYLTGQADQDPRMLAGVTEGLGIRSVAAVPMEVAGERRGVLQAASAEAGRFTEADLHLLGLVARWVGLVAHRAELVDQIRRHAVEQGRRRVADELISVVAHDLRNRLTPATARLQIAQRRAAREGRERDAMDLAEAQRALRRLERLVSDILDAGRIQTGLFSLEMAPTDLVGLAREVAGALDTESNPIRVEAAHDDICVMGDADRLRQALENLVSNAVKHSPEQAPVVVSLGRDEDGARPTAWVCVSDRGPGIPPDVLPRLFDRYAAGPGSAGLGLGLYLARGIAAAHGGSLTVESRPGEGAHFTLTLPATQ